MTWFADFLTAALTVGGIEWGDGTMILCIGLAVMYQQEGRIREVLWGIVIASLLVPTVSIGLASLVIAYVHQIWVHLGSAVVMFSLAVLLLKAALESDGEEKDTWWDRLWTRPLAFAKEKGPFWETFAFFSIMEIPDRTSMATLALQTHGIHWSANWPGSSLGLIIPNLIAIGLVLRIGRDMPKQWLGYFASGLFFCGGGYMLYLFVMEYIASTYI